MSEFKRRADGIPESKLEDIQKKLMGMTVRLSREPSSKEIVQTFSQIREHRNVVSKILVKLIPVRARLRAELIRIERFIEGTKARKLRNNEGFVGCDTSTHKKERLAWLLRDELEIKAAVREDLEIVEELVEMVKIVREELKFAYDEASRALTALEFEFKVETSM